MVERALSALHTVQTHVVAHMPQFDLIELALHGKQKGFDKVIGMIDEMSANLKKEQGDDKIRQETNADCRQAKADLELGLEGVRKALSVPKEYCGRNAVSTIQSSISDKMSQPDRPELHAATGGDGKEACMKHTPTNVRCTQRP